MRSPLAQTPEEAFSEVRIYAGTTQVEFEVDHQPTAVTMVRETVKKSSKNKIKSETCLYLSLIW